jgi:hypothetical protein
MTTRWPYSRLVMESFKDELVNLHQSFRAEGCYKSFAYMFAEFLSAF